MTRNLLLLSFAAFGSCATPPPSYKPWELPTYVSDSGASLIVLEARYDFLDDDSKLFPAPMESKALPTGPEPSSNTLWLGEQALETIIRYVTTKQPDGAAVRFHEIIDPIPRETCDVVFTIPPDETEGFRLKFKAAPSANPAYCDITWEAEFMTGCSSEYARGEGWTLDKQTTERIAGGSGRLPLRASLFMTRRWQADRLYVLILRINSVRE